MKLIKYYLLCFCILSHPIYSYKAEPVYTVHEYYTLANQAFEKNEWIEVIKYSKIIIQNFSNSSFTKDSLFYLGVAYFNLKDFEISNKYFTRYLKDDFNPKYFEEAMHYKYSIAHFFKNGAKKRMFNWKKGPKIVAAEEDAIEIFDEIIASMPNHEIAIRALFAKAEILFDDNEFKEAVSTFETIFERYEKHELAIESFMQIQKVYLKQTTYRKQDPNVLDLAKLNIEKFKESFPLEEEKTKLLEDLLLEMKEKYATGFLEIAQFYEKTNKKEAAILYYNKILNSFSETKSAKIAKARFDNLNEK
ncbi:MAG: Outer membrane protein assembly factor BamD [Candidatus Anoxychlamydiales bacterium]|nr:Outer membrane protein assembly factor BamD [Candidatus Anoxychlamydiales bacterium]